MSRRPSVLSWIRFCALTALIGLVPQLASAAPSLVSAVSRLAHATGNYDVPLPLVAPSGIESRSVAAGMKIVLTFSTNVVSGTAAVTAGTATVNGAPVFSANTMTVNLSGVADVQAVTLTVSNVSDGSTTLPSAAVNFRVLLGDVNASGSVTVSDLSMVRSRETQPSNGSNYRCDVNLVGNITIADTSVVRGRVGKSVAGGAATNTAPTISNITDQSTPVSTPSSAINFTVGDAESAPAALYAWAVSSNEAIVAKTGLAVGVGAGGARTLTVTPVTGAVGISVITVYVSDGIASTADTFIMTVGQPAKLYLALMRPPAGVTSNAAGTATLQTNAAETQASVRLNYSNLGSAKTGSKILHQSGEVLFDIDAATAQPDGSYLWVFAPTASYTVPQIVDAIKNAQARVNITTALNTSGELTGTFQLATGSTTFTPPPSPPALPGGSPTDADACRWLVQATFGPQPDDTAGSIGTINAVKTLGFDAWFDRHTNPANANYVGQTSLRTLLVNRAGDATQKYAFGGGQVAEGWWNLAITAPDQLRQRVAFAYSQIFVVSRIEDAIDAQPAGLASYHDMLATDAFANFRTLLMDVTLHPIMGQYLNMRGNVKQANSSSPLPNENYAREILQLFSIGLNQLHPDGTLKLDVNGLPIATYDQTTIEQFAKVFTGWRENSVPMTWQNWDNTAAALVTVKDYYSKPMVLRTSGNDSGYTPSAGNHDFTQKSLLNNFAIPATTTTTVAQATLELDQAIDNIYNHPNIGPFIGRQLIQRLVCSDPSPAYVYRVGQVFNDNGQGVRGDMKAVIKAILTDYEARTTAYLGNQGYGRVKEPVVRIAQIIRAFHPYSTNPTAVPPLPAWWRLPDTTNDFDQTVYRSPTVFNFYLPDFASGVNLNNPNNTSQTYQVNLLTPEMQITTENSNVYFPRILKKGIIDNAGFIPTSGGSSDVRISLATEYALAQTSVDTFLDSANRLLMAGQMSSNMRTLVRNHMLSITATPASEQASRRVRAALYLITSAPQFIVQK